MASPQVRKLWGVLAISVEVRLYLMARLSSAIMELASGQTTVAPMILPEKSVISLTNPSRKSAVLLRAIKLIGARDFLYFKSLFIQSSSV